MAPEVTTPTQWDCSSATSSACLLPRNNNMENEQEVCKERRKVLELLDSNNYGAGYGL